MNCVDAVYWASVTVDEVHRIRGKSNPLMTNELMLLKQSFRKAFAKVRTVRLQELCAVVTFACKYSYLCQHPYQVLVIEPLVLP